MALRQTPPGEGGRQGRVHFAYVTTKCDQMWTAYIAGPCLWFECHTKGRTKPCLEVLTDGQLTCPRCGEITPTDTIGFQPLYRQVDGRPVFVIVHSYSREVVDKLKFQARVLVTRGPSKTDGVTLNVAPSPDPRFVTTLKERQRPADLTETLLRVWQLPELIAWYNKSHNADVPTCITAPPQKPRHNRATSPGVVPAETDSPPDETPQEAAARAKERSKQWAQEWTDKNRPT